MPKEFLKEKQGTTYTDVEAIVNQGSISTFVVSVEGLDLVTLNCFALHNVYRRLCFTI